MTISQPGSLDRTQLILSFPQINHLKDFHFLLNRPAGRPTLNCFAQNTQSSIVMLGRHVEAGVYLWADILYLFQNLDFVIIWTLKSKKHEDAEKWKAIPLFVINNNWWRCWWANTKDRTRQDIKKRVNEFRPDSSFPLGLVWLPSNARVNYLLVVSRDCRWAYWEKPATWFVHLFPVIFIVSNSIERHE